MRLYASGSVTDKIKIMFNTEYNGAGNDVEVLDAVAQFGFSDQFNVWVGRFLPPSDRSNLYGPYCSHHWAELRCVIGPNGAGKTTMMDVITGKKRPDEGTAWFGQDVNLLSLTEPEIAQGASDASSRNRPSSRR